MTMQVPRIPTLLSAIAVWGAIAVVCGGCGDGGLSGTIPIRGKVTFDGQPLTGAEIRYVPEDPSQGRVARGWLNDKGEFELTTLRENDGALPGTYKVIVLAYESGTGGEGSELASRAREADPEARDPTGRLYAPKLRIPEMYAEPEKTDQVDTVDSSHPGYREFTLTSSSS